MDAADFRFDSPWGPIYGYFSALGLQTNTIHFRIFRPVHGGRARDRVLGAQGNVLRTRFTQRMLRRPVLGLTLSRAMSRRIRS